MEAAAFDFAIIGATPLALLLAGFLAERHKRSVCLVAEFHDDYRLPRGFDLSLAPLTRPETWALLAASEPETTKLVTRVAGKAAFSRLDPMVVAESPAGADALSHARHMALGFGHEVEAIAAGAGLPEGATANRFRDAVLLHRGAMAKGFVPWLESLGVRRVRSGEFQAEFTVLADDEAVLSHDNGLIKAVAATGIATAPAAKLAAPFMTFLDRGLSLHQLDNQGVIAVARGEVEEASGQVGAALPQGARLAGRAAFPLAAATDGAPLLGLSRPGVFTIAGFGATGAFLAAPLARYLAGAASDAEAAWIEARSPLADRSLIVDVVA
ncbi:hypothetical protein [Devosia sp. DBB001]|nr:hypothetical protein [Devosia sp. DBB001]